MQFGGSSGQSGRYLFDVVHRLRDGGIGQQCVDAGEYRVELRQHAFHLRNHVGSLAQRSFLLCAADGVAGCQTGRCGPQPQFKFDVTQQIADNLGRRTLRQLHFAGDVHLGGDIVGMCVVIVYALDDTYLISVGIDRTGGRQAADIIETYEVAVV